MPELPEVETVKRTLIPKLVGKTIKSVDVLYPNIIAYPIVSEFINQLSNQTINDIKRKGKWLIFELDNYYLLSHLRMEGKYHFKTKEDKIEKHEHINFILSDDICLRYNDTRKFGVMYLYKTTCVEEVEKLTPLNVLGLEPFDEKLTVSYLKEKWSKCKKPIKTSLLDQSVICGLGNIYADEVCFMVKINPLEVSNTLSNEDLQKIIVCSKDVLTKAISLGGTTIKSFVNSHAATGLFQNELLVHTKEVCPICSDKIKKIFVGGRGTYFCPNCQKLKS